MNVEKRKRQVKQAINRFGKDIQIYRKNLNEFKEPEGEVVVATVKGYFHKDNQGVKLDISDGSKIIINRVEKLMVIFDEEGMKLKTGDIFTSDNVKYEIVDLGNNFGIYMDMTLRRVI